jgi:transcription-repair coupling factor (superfamily II helicase)
LAAGTTDIIIGTHRLLSRDVVFKDLGLLIIDEEHRFGVAAKEKLRQMKATVDTLTLTATPIPRTLHFSLLGARDLSIIATPPRNRLPVITEIMQYDDALIREAILREIQRGGQVFFVHDRVQTMDELVERLQTLVPNVRIRKAHGQMAAHELEEVMLAFLERKFDVLVATKIIESGIDIPNVNTIIINRADRFGMAELYQLRGRVGRSNVQAYAYLLVPPISSLPRETVRRLQAVEEFTELGSGFNLAMRDLEIRGAGNLLGGEQSGFIEAMGFEMYTRVLEEAVAELKEQEFQEMFQQQRARTSAREQTVVDAEFDVRIPEAYIDDGNERLSVYRRLFGVSGVEEVDAIAAELKDRFGPYPQAVEHLLELVRLRLKATMMGFRKLTVGKKSVVLEFPPESDTQFYESAAFQSLMSHVSHMNKKQAVLRQQGKMLSLVYSVDPSSGADPFHTAHHLLDELLDLSQNASERAQAVTAG